MKKIAKGNKKKGKVMTLSEFHSTTGPANESAASSQSANLVRLNWADEMEKLDDDSSPAPNDLLFDRSKLPTAPKAALMPDVDLQAVPKQAPFTAYVSNISFEADEDRLRAFFKDSKVLRTIHLVFILLFFFVLNIKIFCFFVCLLSFYPIRSNEFAYQTRKDTSEASVSSISSTESR